MAIVALVVGLAVPLAAQEHGRSIQTILSEIKQEQNVQRVEQIDPDKVSEAQLAELGEAVMDVRFPNERQHAYMDEMMGGEGSPSLEAMHRSMGYSYLAGGGESGWGRGIMSAAPGVWILVVLLGTALVVLSIVLATRRNRRGD